ncbi:hypothetical protein Pint_01508 [Pistacia integerrima]|uniref:Uncharacterized protein n=1 Tax=Pistacia integerrima TaxID=434235 RepID=A0ACC0ZQX7_9ROSI|nr:hypothetical protein Pint_01508 [Pistacia integerrima]
MWNHCSLCQNPTILNLMTIKQKFPPKSIVTMTSIGVMPLMRMKAVIYLLVLLGMLDGEAGDNDGGDGREERAETSDNEGEVRAETSDNEGEVRAETRGHLSDYEKKSDDFMGRSSEDEDVVSRMSRHKKASEFQYGPDGKIKFEVGQVFRNKIHFNEIFKDYIIQRGFAVRRVHNDKRRIKAVCKEEGCPFFLYAALMVDKQSWQIKKYETNHTCLRVYNNPNAFASWIAKKMEGFIRSHKGSCVKPLDAKLGNVHFWRYIKGSCIGLGGWPPE